ncbi:MAG: 4a-hydroxytetrahydrobiopterin dehydratase [Steroidobacteraceae bacterium]
MSELSSKHCVPCEGGVEPLNADATHHFMQKLSLGWTVDTDGKAIHRKYAFKNFYRTMSFVNAVAHIANTEDHHPDLEVGYNYCIIRFSTHAIGGLSENDFICAAKIDQLES